MTNTFTTLNIVNHPLIKHKLARIRDKKTNNLEFRALLNEIASLMVYEITREIPTKKIMVETPLETTECEIIKKDLTLVPILRAGLGMVEGILQLVPNARVGHIGLYRDESSLEAIEYYKKFPLTMPDSKIILIDPMLATGVSASSAISFIKNSKGKDISFVCLVSAPQGVKKIIHDHPDVPIYTSAFDRTLNEKAYILPGLGDAGDRIYGTE